MPPLKIEYLSIQELKPHPRNARTHSRKQRRQLAAIIRRVGFNSPVVIDEDGDASNIEGLAAPYDEEETDQVVHVEKLDAGLDLFQFWLEHQNSDQISSRNPEPRIFST